MGKVRGYSGMVVAVLVTGSVVAWVGGSVWWRGSNSSLKRSSLWW